MSVEIRVALVDDHSLMRQGIKRVMATMPEFRWVAEADSAAGALRLCERRRGDFDVLVLDSDLPGFSVIDVVAEITRRAPELQLVVALPDACESSVVPLARLGVLGMVTKLEALEVLLDAVRAVSHGRFYASKRVSETMLTFIMSGRNGNENEFDLSPRELQTVRLVCSGKSSKEIAELFGISDVTVRGYRKEIYRKMGCNSVSALVTKALQCGLAPRAAAAAVGQ